MKINKYSAILAALALAGTFTACKNSNNDFPNYQGGYSVYFAHQYVLRTLTMGDDNWDTSLDNAHKCEIYATQGGGYTGKDITLQVAVDNTLTDNLTFDGTKPVQAMPENYYKLTSNTIDFKGEFLGCVGVEFTDAFFNDPLALTENYVIPLVITSQKGADRILSGTPAAEGNVPPRTKSDAWSVVPQDYVLYCVNYVNKYDAKYLVRGVDNVTEGGQTTKQVRHAQYVENDEVRAVGTRSLTQAVYPVSTVITDADGNKHTQTCDLILTFNGDDQCTITTDTPGCTASGTGKFVKDGEKKSWGNKDRNAMYLEYTIDFGTRSYQTLDTLVVQTRDIAPARFFTPEYKN